MTRRLILAVCVAMLFTPAHGWNPYAKRSDAPLRWPAATAVPWSYDGGKLGQWKAGTPALEVQDAFDLWEDVATSTLDFTLAGQITHPISGTPIDVTAATFPLVVNADNGENPIIFDNDLDIISSIGIPPSVAGFTSVVRTTGPTIDKAFVLINGDFYNGDPNDSGEFTVDEFRHVIVHELGHFSGLGHSSVNHELVSGVGVCPLPSVDQIETMTPFVESGMTPPLQHDDRMGLSHLYPSGTFNTDHSRIGGRIVNRNGVLPLYGANIVLRPITVDCDELYEASQSFQAGANPGEFGEGAGYEFPGLTPGADYSLLATTIQDGGSYPIGAAILEGPDDYYNGLNEDHFDPPDLPTEVGSITAGPGGVTTGGLDILINNPEGPTTLASVGPHALSAALLDGQTALPSELLVVDLEYGEEVPVVDPATTRVAWVNRFVPSPNQLPLQIDRLEAYFTREAPIDGRPIRILVYVDPGATGDIANASLAYTEDTTIPVAGGGANGFDFYSLTAPVTVTAGDFYVGFYDLVSNATPFFGALDPFISGDSFAAFNSTVPAAFAPMEQGNFYIRARISVTPEADSVWLTWGDTCNEATVEGQDFVVYEGNLSTLDGIQDHEPATCSTSGQKSWVVLPHPGDLFWLATPRVSTREGELGTGSAGRPRTPVTTCATVHADSCP